MTNAALPLALKSVTSTKILELKKQRRNFEDSQQEIFHRVKRARTTSERANQLLEGVCALEGLPRVESDESDSEVEWQPAVTDAKRKLASSRHILRLAKRDPAFPKDIVEKQYQELQRDLELKSVRHEHAQFFSELVTEWLSSHSDPRTTQPTQGDTAMESSSFETVGRKEMHEQRAQWESLVFKEANVDGANIKAYLEKLFTYSKVSTTALEKLRKSTAQFGQTLRYMENLFDVEQLKMTIKGLIATDLLSEEKVEILQTFLSNDQVLTEVSDVLNMRFTSLDGWNWDTNDGALSLEMRKQLNGRYRVFVDEDVLDALLLHEIGLRWSIHFKTVLTSFFHSPAWRKSTRLIPNSDRERREYFVGPKPLTKVQRRRLETYRNTYFLTQLPESLSQGAKGYDEMESEQSGTSEPKGPVEIKHHLLHLLITEAIMNRHLRPTETHTVVRSDFEWFGPSLAHETIFTVLEFYGINDFWLSFFKKFLETPVRFVQDGQNGDVQVRKRGVPMSHALSDCFGEVVLYVMDFAVNQATHTNLYRLHDDFWLWGSEDVCERGWKAMTLFASTIGLKFNKDKTGTVKFLPNHNKGSEPTSTTSLPKGDVRWGFLKLDAAQMRFVIDQDMVDTHIKELQLQLSYCNSIFSYIQAYNAYLARFFGNNFGKPSYAFGREHIDMMIDTFVRVQYALFQGGSVTDHLSKMASDRFGVKDIPAGFWYWPVNMGGTELRNPLISLFAMRETLRKTPKRILKQADDLEETAYTIAKEEYEQNGSKLERSSAISKQIESDGGSFMSRDEYNRYREEYSAHLLHAYDKLLRVPTETSIDKTAETKSWLESLPSVQKTKDFNTIGHGMQPYWTWILAIHGGEMVQKYGRIQLVDGGQVPLGIVGMMKSGKVRWKG